MDGWGSSGAKVEAGTPRAGGGKLKTVAFASCLVLFCGTAQALEPAAAPVGEGAPEVPSAASDAAGAGSASSAPAENTRRVEWQPGWHRFGWVNLGVIAGGAGAAGLALLIGPDTDSPRQLKNSFDESVRDALRPRSESTREAFLYLSDVSLGLNIAYAYVGDALLNAGVYRRSPDVAWQLALIDTQVIALALGVQLWTANLVSRERPYGRTCGSSELPEDASECTGDYRYRSFFSSHTTLAFAMATATCTHNAYVPLYPGAVAWVPCAGTLALAGFTGYARIAADQHYATDVAVGAVVGSTLGWLVPFLHYVGGGSPRAPSASTDYGTLPLVPVSWSVVPMGPGAAVVGTF